MRTSSAFVAVLLVAGCGKGGKDKDGTGGTGDTPTIPDISFAAEVNATSMLGDVDSEALLAHRSANLVLGAIGLAVADEGVRSKMQGHSDGSRSNHCWTGPLIPQSTFTLDYTNCATVGVGGGLIFNEDPLGPISLDFKNVAFDVTRKVNGALGFDAAGAVPSHWRTYGTIGTEPTQANWTEIPLQVDGRDISLDFDGGAFMRSVNQNIAVWGVLTLTPYGGEAIELLLGGTDAASLTSNDDPAEPASMPWSYLSCRCPTAGVSSMEMGFTVTEVRFDLDDLKTEDDGVDDPEAKVDVTVRTTGPVEYRPVDCGEWEVTYNGTEGTEVELSSEELKDAIQNLCDTAVIGDGGRCAALLKAAGDTDGITVKIGPNRLANAVATEAAVEFDTSYCNP